MEMNICNDCINTNCKQRKFLKSYKNGLLLIHLKNCNDKLIEHNKVIEQ